MTAKRGETFFFVMGLLLIAVVIAGFAPGAYQRLQSDTELPWFLHLHGAVFLGWFMLFTLQARLVETARVATHMRLGKLSVLLAAAMLSLALLVIRSAYANPDFSIAGMSPAASTMFPVTDIVNFSIMFTLGLLLRKTAATHKRCMLLAGILMIDPAMARVVFSIGAPAPVILLLELGLLAALIVYDLRTRGRPHWVSLTGVGLYLAATLAKFHLSGSASWTGFTALMFG